MKILTPTEAAEFALSAAKNAQCEADVVVTTSKDLSLKADSGALSEYKVTSSNVLGLRLLRDGKVSTSFTEALDSESITASLNMALENLPYTELAEHESLVANRVIKTETPEIYCDDDTPEADKVALALSLESQVAEKGGKSPYNAYSDGESELIYMNSLGANGYHKERAFSCYTSALISGDGTPSMGIKASTARTFAELDAQGCVDTALQKATSLLDGKPISTGRYAVIFDIACLSQLFSAFSLCLSGEAARKETNPWRDKLTQHVASPLFNLSDYAAYDKGLAIKAFDGEGIETQDTALIVGGELRSLLHNSKTAAHFGLKTTGNAARSAKSGLSVSSRHKVIEPGQASDTDLETGTYFVPIELQGVHSGANAISGDFSFGASGYLYRDGELVQPVRGVTIAGNFYQMLKDIDAVGAHVERADSGTFFSPRIRFSQLNISGQ
ncbi:TldD/PmbA family protein [Thaumasiovibrio subtropicus]|uniref:TldD/PmbA family protein n=1 Tax=Thaumasiovibrio subtropicus TaxID=1891207 RepID=UPI000B36166C|nr:TldD/PmbA family protein [Thaumasiovibrio subtropicus]